MLIPSEVGVALVDAASLSRRVNANSQRKCQLMQGIFKLIKKGEC